MRKLTALLLTLILLLTLAACSSNESDQATSTAAIATTAASTSEPAATAAIVAMTTPMTVPASGITFDKQSVADNDDIAITITGINPEGLLGFELEVNLVNKSADTTYQFDTSTTYVNGVLTSSSLSCDVKPVESVDTIIHFPDNRMTKAGNTVFTDIELTFELRPADASATSEPIWQETVHIYPYGEENSVIFQYQPQSGDIVIYDSEFATIVVTGYEVNEDDGEFRLYYYALNKTDTAISFPVEETYINGFEMSSFDFVDLPAGAGMFMIQFWEDDDIWEDDYYDIYEAGMESVADFKDFKILMSVINADNPGATPYATQTLEFTLQ